MTKSKALSKKESNVPAVAGDLDAWGEAPALSIRDLIIPRILVNQGMSKKVLDGEGVFGEIVDSITGDKLAGKGETIELIPFKMEKVWIVRRKKGDVFKFAGVEPVTPANEDQPIVGEDEQGAFEKDRTYNFYCLTPDKIGEADLPYVVSFRRTSARAGRELANIMYVRNRQAGLVPPATVINLGAEKRDRDGGAAFMVFTVSAGRKATEKEIQAAKAKFQALGALDHKVDYSSEEGELKTVSDAPTTTEDIPF